MQAPRVGDVLKIWRQAGKIFWAEQHFPFGFGRSDSAPEKILRAGMRGTEMKKKKKRAKYSHGDGCSRDRKLAKKKTNISKSLLPLHLLRENEYQEILKTEKLHIVVFRNRSGNSSVPAGSHGYGGNLGLDGRTMQGFSLQPVFLGSGGINSAP